MSEPTAIKPSPVPGTKPWVKKRKGSYEFLPPNMSEDLGDKLSRLKVELYQKMDLEDFSKKFGLLKADMDRNMDQHVVRHRLEDLRSDLHRKIQNQHELKEHFDRITTDIERLQKETSRTRDTLDEKMQEIEDISVKLQKKQAEINFSVHRNIRFAMISFCVIAIGVLVTFLFEFDSVIPLHISEGITYVIICAAIGLVGYILGYWVNLKNDWPDIG